MNSAIFLRGRPFITEPTDDARRAFWSLATTERASVGWLVGGLAWSAPRVRRALRELEMMGAIERWRDPKISARSVYYRPVYAVNVPQPTGR